ncbi:Uncharacterised protein [Chlamydia trachomatis]|nr:Uncharacterised protein [Chlamydia trachomatis]
MDLMLYSFEYNFIILFKTFIACSKVCLAAGDKISSEKIKGSIYLLLGFILDFSFLSITICFNSLSFHLINSELFFKSLILLKYKSIAFFDKLPFLLKFNSLIEIICLIKSSSASPLMKSLSIISCSENNL